MYDAFDQLTAEYASAAPSTSPCTPCYLSADHLGSVRLVTDPQGTIVARHDYLPFGEEIPAGQAGRPAPFGFGAPDGLRRRFTGQEHDSESGLDDFGARYYGSALGRFTSVDPGPDRMDVTNQQSFNRYAYAWNNPLVNTDQTGADT